MKRSRFYDWTGLTPRNVATANDPLKMVNHAYRYPSIRHFSTDKQQIVRPGRASWSQLQRLINNPAWQISCRK